MASKADEKRDARLEALGSAIRTARAERGISQEKLAAAAGADRSHMGRIERGENNVSVLTVLRLAEAIGVEASDLLRSAGL